MTRQVKDHGGMSSDEWCSPPEVTVPLHDFWGVADVDPCSNLRSIVRAQKRHSAGGLVFPWGKKTYANWPYSQNDDWSKKAVHEMDRGHVRELVVLCMTATSTYWWQRLMHAERNPRVLLTKRILFLGPDGKPVDSSRFEPALLYYGPGSRWSTFDKTFRHLTRWSTWGRSARA